MQKIVECVPNFSEGRDLDKIKMITDSIDGVPGVKVIHVDPGAATNRTVVTFVGSPEGVREAAFRAVEKAREVIDMTQHKGEHPRMGAADVFPFIPVSGVTMDECVEISRKVGERIGRELGIPVYLYENSATRPERRSLAYIRSGEYEGFREKIYRQGWEPDYGPREFNPGSGCTTMGAREFLIAYNVDIDSPREELAQRIAEEIRESGRVKRDENGKIIRDTEGKALRMPGLLKNVRGVGWYIEEYEKAQVSINITNYNVSPIHRVYEACVDAARRIGTRVTGSEIIGLVPMEAVLEAGKFYQIRNNKSPDIPEEKLIETARISMGLDDVSEFLPEKKIIEYLIREPKPLISMSLKHFINEVSIDSPVPGGGSVAALAAALGAALSSMVGNLTVNKGMGMNMPPCEVEEFNSANRKLREILGELNDMIDADSEAYGSVVNAMKMPKNTDEEMRVRGVAIQNSFKEAALVPLAVMEKCIEILPVIKYMARHGQPGAISDMGVSALMVQAGVKGAGFNVKINLDSIKDADFVTELDEKLGSFLKECDIVMGDIMEIVKKKLDNG